MPAVIAAIESKRVSNALSYSQVARELGVTYRTVAYWRRGHCVMSGDVILRVCIWVGRPIDVIRPRACGSAPRGQGEGGLGRAKALACHSEGLQLNVPSRSHSNQGGLT